MRTIDYRRKQEAKHYKKRLNISIKKNRYKEYTDENGNNIIVPISKYKNQQPWVNQNDENNIKQNIHKRWKYALKNNSCPSEMSNWSKRYCRRIRRHFQKLVDYKLPDKKWMVRDEALPRILTTISNYYE